MNSRRGKQAGERSGRRGVQLPEKFGWLMSLSAADRNAFVSELLQALAHNGSKAMTNELIEDWRATAEAWSNPAIAKALRKAGKTTYTDWQVTFGRLSRRSVQ